MTNLNKKSLLILQAGLFPDGEVVEKAIRSLSAKHDISSCEVKPLEWGEKDWDKALGMIRAADEVITI